MVKGNTTAKKLARELKSSNPELNYTQALAEVKTPVDEIITQEIFDSLSESLQKLMPLGGKIGSKEKSVLTWNELAHSLGDGWVLIAEGHFNSLALEKPVEGHMFGLKIVNSVFAEDTLELAYAVDYSSVVVTFPLNEDEMDLGLGDGEQFSYLKFSRSVDPKGKTTAEFFEEISKIAKNFANAHSLGREPEGLRVNEEVQIECRMAQAWEAVAEGDLSESSVRVLDDFIKSSKQLQYDVGTVLTVVTGKLDELYKAVR